MTAHDKLRWITRDGEKVLQQLWKDTYLWTDDDPPGPAAEWRDVPTELPMKGTSKVRWIDKDGRRILQQLHASEISREWRDVVVPTETEEYEYLTLDLEAPTPNCLPGWEHVGDGTVGIATFRRIIKKKAKECVVTDDYPKSFTRQQIEAIRNLKPGDWIVFCKR